MLVQRSLSREGTRDAADGIPVAGVPVAAEPVAPVRGGGATGDAGAALVNTPSSEGRIDERALVDRARTGDVEAQGELFDQYWPRVVRFAFARCGNLQDAEDLASEVFLRMVEAIGRFEWRENIGFAAWLFRIAHNQVVSHYRRRGGTVPLPEEGQGEPADQTDLQLLAEVHLAASEIYRVAQRLPRAQQEVIQLRFAADLSLADTARILKKKENNIKQLQHKAVARMRQLLDAGEEAHGAPP